jgi:hypothetical protein
MEKQIKDFILKSIAESLDIHKTHKGYSLSFPILDRDMNYLHLTFKQNKDGEIIISDRGEIYGDLYIAGLDPYDDISLSHKIKRICKTYGIQEPTGQFKELKMTIKEITPTKERSQRFRDFLNGILQIRSLSYSNMRNYVESSILDSYTKAFQEKMNERREEMKKIIGKQRRAFLHSQEKLSQLREEIEKIKHYPDSLASNINQIKKILAD